MVRSTFGSVTVKNLLAVATGPVLTLRDSPPSGHYMNCTRWTSCLLLVYFLEACIRIKVKEKKLKTFKQIKSLRKDSSKQIPPFLNAVAEQKSSEEKLH